MYIYTLFIFPVFINIARIAALARNFNDFASLDPGTHMYHETPLHNLNDLADLGVESDGSKSDKLKELNEILEDESQSPDEQSVSKYEENIKVFQNPVVLEATSHPTEDEVKDFEKVKEHEKATEDNHFDSLTSLVKNSSLFKLNNNNLLKEEVEENKSKNNQYNKDSDHESNENNGFNNDSGYQKNDLNYGENENENEDDEHRDEEEKNKNQNENVEFNKPSVEQNTNVPKRPFSLSNLFNNLKGLHSANSGNTLGFNAANHLASAPGLAQAPNLQNPLAAALNPELLKHVKLPPVTVNAQSKNNFHFFNVHHHHHHKPLQPHFELHEVSPHLPNSFATRECFEGSFNGEGPGNRCYCSKDNSCKCTKTFMMLVSVCDTLLNDSDLKEFCSHESVKDDHPNLNFRFSKGVDKFVWDAFKNVQSSLCNNKTLSFCENVVKMEKLCQCTKCD